jgi:cytochrome c oxidase subunit II
LASVGRVSAPPAETAAHPAPRRRWRRLGVFVALALPVLLGGCQLPSFWEYRGATQQSHDEFLLWVGTFIAAIVVGGITAALILWAVFRYRRRSDEIPRQFQYHIGLELTYTFVPIVIVLVLFGFTVAAENRIDAVSPHPALSVRVSAFQWGWRFAYSGHNVTVVGATTNDPDPVGLDGRVCAPATECLGPGLVLPVDRTVGITLVSLDVIHGFYVPQFNFSRYAQPGFTNHFDFNIKRSGIYRAQCTQLCGLYHSLMFFHVVALPPAQFQAWLSSEQTSGSALTTKAAA